jgi:hypothetical protein
LDTQTIREIHSGALREIDMTWVVMCRSVPHVSTCGLSREMDEPALRFIGSLAMIFCFSDPPADGELQEKFV